MTWSLVGSGQSNSNKTGTNPTSITLPTVQANDLIVIGVTVDSAAAATVVGSPSDDLGNTYAAVPDDTAGTCITNIGDAGGRVCAGIFYSKVTSAGTPTVGYNFSTTWTAGCIVGWVFRPSLGDFTYIDTVTATVNATSGVTMTCAAGAGQNAGDLIVGVLGWEGPDTNYSSGDADTTGGAWNTAVTNGTSGGSAVTNIGICSQWKTPSSGTSQSFSSTLTTARDYAGGIVGFREQSTAVTGSASPTEGDDTSTATGTVVNPVFLGINAVVRGRRVRRVFRASTARPFGLVFHKGTASATETADTSTASGTFTPPPITGTATPTEGDDTSTASGTFQQNITGTATPTEGDDTSTASGAFTPAFQMAFLLQARNRRVRRYKRGSTVRPFGLITFHRGTAAVTETADTSTASGAFVPPPITGSASPTEGDDTSTTSGIFSNDMVGSASPSEGNDSSTASGNFQIPIVISPSPTTRRRIRRRYRKSTVRPHGQITFYRATSTAGETADTSTASGTVINPIAGTASPGETADTSTASGTFTPPPITGTASPTEGNDTSTATGVAIFTIVAFPVPHLRPRPVYKRPNKRSTTWRIVHPIVGTAAASEQNDEPFANGSVPISAELLERRKRRGGYEPPTRPAERRDFFETKRRVRNLEP